VYGSGAIGGKAIDETAARSTDSSLAGVAVLDNSDGVINNSSGRSEGASAGMSLIGDSGMAGAAINQLNNNYDIPQHSSTNPLKTAWNWNMNRCWACWTACSAFNL